MLQKKTEYSTGHSVSTYTIGENGETAGSFPYIPTIDYSDFTNSPAKLLSLTADKKLLCLLYSRTAGEAAVYKYGFIELATGNVTEIVTLASGDGLTINGDAISDINNNSIFYGSSKVKAYDSAGTLLFSKSLIINNMAAGKNGVYGVNYSLGKLYRL